MVKCTVENLALGQTDCALGPVDSVLCLCSLKGKVGLIIVQLTPEQNQFEQHESIYTVFFFQ